MSDFLVVLGVIAFVGAMLGLYRILRVDPKGEQA
jgi:hypothetical protein